MSTFSSEMLRLSVVFLTIITLIITIQSSNSFKLQRARYLVTEIGTTKYYLASKAFCEVSDKSSINFSMLWPIQINNFKQIILSAMKPIKNFKHHLSRSVAIILFSLCVFFSAVKPAFPNGHLSGSTLTQSQPYRSTTSKNKDKAAIPTPNKSKAYVKDKAYTNNKYYYPKLSNNNNQIIYKSNHYNIPSPSMSTEILFTLILSFMFLNIPMIQSFIKSKLGLWCISYYQIQLTYLLTNSELLQHLSKIERISSKYKERTSSSSSSSSSSSLNNYNLINLIGDICVANLAIHSSLIGGKIMATRTRDSSRNLEEYLNQLRTTSIEERSRAISIDSSPQYFASSTPSPFAQYSSSYTSSSSSASTYGHHTELRPSSSFFVMTLLLVALGPSLNGASYQKSNPFKPNQVKSLLTSLPAYLRLLEDIKRKKLNMEDKDVVTDDRLPGFEVELVWSPQSVSTITSHTYSTFNVV